MKKLIIFLGVLIGGSLIFHSCTKENSLLDDGDVRESFVGSWVATDDCSKQTYGVDIKIDDDNSSQVIIVNYANLGKSVEGVIAGNNIYVENQHAGSAYKVTGNGKLTGAVISWTSYNYETDAELVECVATFNQ